MKGQTYRQVGQVPEEHMRKPPKRPNLPWKFSCPIRQPANQVVILDRELVQQAHQLRPTTLSDKTGLKCCLWDKESRLPSNSSVFPDPNLPQMRESSPWGKFNDMSTKTNLCLGVDAAEDAWLLALRSCGHVTVQDWNATVLDCWSRGGTAFTSAALRYFSRRRRETKLWEIYENTNQEETMTKKILEANWWKFRVKH